MDGGIRPVPSVRKSAGGVPIQDAVVATDCPNIRPAHLLVSQEWIKVGYSTMTMRSCPFVLYAADSRSTTSFDTKTVALTTHEMGMVHDMSMPTVATPAAFQTASPQRPSEHKQTAQACLPGLPVLHVCTVVTATEPKNTAFSAQQSCASYFETDM